MRKSGLLALVVAPALALAAGDKQEKAASGEKGSMQGGKVSAVKQFRAEDGFFTSPNYDIEGRIASVSGDKITIRRDGLPEAQLSIAANTKVQLDGNTASAQQLKEGQEVRAKFNLRGETPVALEVEAERRDERQRGERTTTPPATNPPQRDARQR